MGVIESGGPTETRVEKGLFYNPVPFGPVEDILGSSTGAVTQTQINSLKH